MITSKQGIVKIEGTVDEVAADLIQVIRPFRESIRAEFGEEVEKAVMNSIIFASSVSLDELEQKIAEM